MGIDGMDPLLLKEFIAKGRMPNFERLIAMGDFKPLTSSIPPQSPVAWSNFTTGQNPGQHGIFDFIHRDPQAYTPYLSTSKAEDPDPKDSIVIGNRVIWLKSGDVKLLRQGKPFWEYLAEDRIFNRVFKVPANFPPYQGLGWSGSGMGTPDLQGTYGEFTYFTDFPPEHAEAIGGGTVQPVDTTNNVVRAKLVGPKNTFALDPKQGRYTEYQGDDGKTRRDYHHPQAEVPITIYLDRERQTAKLEFQDVQLLLKPGEWTDFVPIVFELWPHVVEVKGIVRFYLKEVAPNFKLYASPINMDPTDPALPLTSPPEYGQQIAADLGYYYTQGMPENTKARQANLDILDDAELFHQMMLVHAEDVRLFNWHLDHWRDGLLFYYFGTLDLGTHMFWRLHDPTHPAYDPKGSEKLGGDPLEQLYHLMDGVLGMTIARLEDPKTKQLPPDLTLVIMSDHGFAAWKKSFQTNTWLLQNGYLVLKPDITQEKIEYFRYGADYAVDWSRTRAYAVGLNGLYINLAGREAYGVVQPFQKKELVDELAQKLEAYVDPSTCRSAPAPGDSAAPAPADPACVKPLVEAYKAYQVYQGDALDVAPDLVLGFRRGYRGGDDSALGKFPKDVITENDSSWSGDHCIATSEVPGILISNRKSSKPDPALIDLGPSILKLFGKLVPKNMDGKPIW